MPYEWLTYAAAGERLGISPDAMRHRAIRHEWSKRAGNDGRTEIRIDVDELIAAQPPRDRLERSPEKYPMSDPSPVRSPADARALGALVAALQERIARAEALLDREREVAAEERVMADAERMRADRERDRADALSAELAQLRLDGTRQVAGLEHVVERLRLMIAAISKDPVPMRPWWIRLAA